MSADVPGSGPASTGTPAVHIGEVAERTELSLRSLRHWHEVGLVRPSGRSAGGFRLYTEEDIARILLIRRMKPLGFTLEEMKDALRDLEGVGDPETSPEARDRLARLRTDAEERRDRLVRQLTMAEEFIDLLHERLR